MLATAATNVPRAAHKAKSPQTCGDSPDRTPQAYLLGAIAGVLESLFAGVACFFFPFALTFLPSFSILPVPPAPGVGAMLGVLELWLGGSASFLGPLAFAFALVPGS